MKIVNGFNPLVYTKEKKLLLPTSNTTSLEMTKTIIKGLNAVHLPDMVQISFDNLHLSSPEVIAYMVRKFLKGTDIPIGLYLDHGKSLDDVKVCVGAGLTSVMAGASRLDFEENIKEIKKTVEYCRFYHVPAKAELGAVMGKKGDDVNEADCKTNPALVKESVECPGCNIPAVSIGNVHGFDAMVKIGLALLKRIAEVSPVPLMLRNGSGIPFDQAKQMRNYNMIKVNYGSNPHRMSIQTFGGVYEENYSGANLYGLSTKAVENVDKTAADLVLTVNGLKESQEGIDSVYYIGLDIGTSVLKTTLVNARRSIVHENDYDYAILQPQEGWREIDPDVWMQVVMKGLHDIFTRCNPQGVSVTGVTGQIHTTVFLDKNGRAAHNVIM